MRQFISCSVACLVLVMATSGCAEKGSNIPTQPVPTKFVPGEPTPPGGGKGKGKSEVGFRIERDWGQTTSVSA